MAPELVFLKLGGSLLTDKTQAEKLRGETLARLAGEVASALARRPELRLLIGHGSGSFGHVTAARYGTRAGVRSPAQWRGFAETSVVAGRLNRAVVEALFAAGVPVLPIQPSASARCVAGVLLDLDDRPVRAALAQGLVPLVYGDVALDDSQGGTIISTEEIFCWLAGRVAPQRIILVGEVAGVLSADPRAGPAGEVIPEITPATLSQWLAALGGARGIDVTGGMVAKVREMLSLLQETRSLACVQLITGLTPHLLETVLVDPAFPTGTRLRRDG